MANQQIAAQKIDSLTPLRFLACLVIITCHSRGHFGLPSNLGAPFVMTQSVSFFFLLSGFIMAFVYPNLDKAGATGKYWLARFARIWPLHLFMFILYVLLLPELSHYGPLTALTNLMLVQSWIPNQSWFFSFNGVTWSIGTECFFYLAFPFLIKDFERNWPAKLGLSFLLVIIMVQLANWLHAPSFSPDQVSVHGLTYINPLSRLFEFVVGMTSALFYRKYVMDRHAKPIVALGVELLAIGLLFGLSAYTAKIAHWCSRLPFVEEGGRMWVENCGISTFTCIFLILVMAWGRGPISAVLRTKPLVLLGEMSFSVYLLHRMFLHYYWNHFSPVQGPWPIAIYLAALIAASYASWSLIEMPCRQLILRGPAAFPRPRLKSCLVLACVVATFFGIWSGSPLERLDLNAVKEAQLEGTTAGAALARDGLADIAFGEDLLLLGSHTSSDATGLKLTLYWQALRKQKIDNYISLQLLSENNSLVRLKDYRQSLREEVVERGDCFKNELFVPASELQYVRSLAFGLTRAIGEAPRARSFNPQSPCSQDRFYKGLVAVKIDPVTVAGKPLKPAL